MKKTFIYTTLIIFCVAILAMVGFSFLGKKKTNEVSKPIESKKEFRLEKIYFSETEDPNDVLLNIKITSGKKGVWRYEIYFPPQEGLAQGIGPIEVDNGAKPTEFKPEVEVPEEVLIQEQIARSYPEGAPEFGKSYFGKIKLYLTDGNTKEWEGKVDWEKIKGGEEGAKKGQIMGFQGSSSPKVSAGTGNGEITASFPATTPDSPTWQALQKTWVPDLTGAMIWGYEVRVNGNHVADWPAVYTPSGVNSYTLTDPQSLTITGLVPGNYYLIEIYPLGVWTSFNLVTPEGKRYLIAKFGPNNFSWAWSDAKGQPISPWSPLSRLPAGAEINNPGYFEEYKLLWSARLQAKRSGGGGGGGGGQYQ